MTPHLACPVPEQQTRGQGPRGPLQCRNTDGSLNFRRQQAGYPDGKLLRAEGFDQVITGPRLEGPNDIALQAAGGQHDNWNAGESGIALDVTQDGKPVLPRHHGVEHDQIRSVGSNKLEGLAAVSG